MEKSVSEIVQEALDKLSELGAIAEENNQHIIDAMLIIEEKLLSLIDSDEEID